MLGLAVVGAEVVVGPSLVPLCLHQRCDGRCPHCDEYVPVTIGLPKLIGCGGFCLGNVLCNLLPVHLQPPAQVVRHAGGVEAVCGGISQNRADAVVARHHHKALDAVIEDVVGDGLFRRLLHSFGLLHNVEFQLRGRFLPVLSCIEVFSNFKCCRDIHLLRGSGNCHKAGDYQNEDSFHVCDYLLFIIFSISSAPEGISAPRSMGESATSMSVSIRTPMPSSAM